MYKLDLHMFDGGAAAAGGAPAAGSAAQAGGTAVQAEGAQSEGQEGEQTTQRTPEEQRKAMAGWSTVACSSGRVG